MLHIVTKRNIPKIFSPEYKEFVFQYEKSLLSVKNRSMALFMLLLQYLLLNGKILLIWIPTCSVGLGTGEQKLNTRIRLVYMFSVPILLVTPSAEQGK